MKPLKNYWIVKKNSRASSLLRLGEIKMDIRFSIDEAVRKRYSVRNYNGEIIEENIKEKIRLFMASLDNPFGKDVFFHFLDNEDVNKEEKLGTYGVIKGASQYIGTTIEKEDFSLEALGYELEVLMLYLSDLNIGTCWLGGTFDRKGFAKAMDIGENQLFPAITPYGYAAQKKHIKEMAMRKMIKAEQRKDWKELFFKDNFDNPISKEDAADLEFAFEMVRLGPSASNKQPWRIVLIDNTVHFYQHKEPKYSEHFPYDIQKIDMGIAAAHFELAVREKGIKGEFKYNLDPELKLPENIIYAFSWSR